MGEGDFSSVAGNEGSHRLPDGMEVAHCGTDFARKTSDGRRWPSDGRDRPCRETRRATTSRDWASEREREEGNERTWMLRWSGMGTQSFDVR